MRSLYFLVPVFLWSCAQTNEKNMEEGTSQDFAKNVTVEEGPAPFDLPVSISPLNHATFVLQWDSITLYNDPNGGAAQFEVFNDPDIILISDIHGDHLNRETLDSLDRSHAVLVMPQAVADRLPPDYSVGAVILANGEETEIKGLNIRAIPMYNLPETEDSRHPKGRGNGYIISRGDYDVYIAGDTEAIPEMRNLEGIDLAFIPMNLPYTMDVKQAADGVLDFAPKVVVPYHYRGQGGLSDIMEFKQIVNQGNKDIHVWLLDGWYEEL